MAYCAACGTENAEGLRYCIRCGAMLPPQPGTWRMTEEGQRTQHGSVNQTSPPLTYQPQVPPQYRASDGEPIHPVIPALISFLFPGLGLLFVPNKVGLAIAIFIGYAVGITIYSIVAALLLFVGVGLCLFLFIPVINVLIALHSYDEAAKASNGKYQPILFK
jgi:hypothetical protein